MEICTLSRKPDYSQWRRLQLFLSNGFSKIVFQSGVNKTHQPLDKDRTSLILSFTYPVSSLYPFLSGPLAPSSRHQNPVHTKLGFNRVSRILCRNRSDSNARTGDIIGRYGAGVFKFSGGCYVGEGIARGGWTRSGTGEIENGPKKHIERKSFFLVKRKGQKSQDKKKNIRRQTKGKRTSNSHDHLFKAKCTKSPFLFSGAKKVRLE